jgi:hypothetical protein
MRLLQPCDILRQASAGPEMRTPYHAIPQPGVVTIPDPVTGINQNFPSTPNNFTWAHGAPFGDAGLMVGTSGTGQVVPAGSYAYAINLISCAAAIYIYTNGGGVQGVAFFHAHTGDIPVGYGPMRPAYNVTGAAAANTFVVFASSQSMTPNPNDGIQTAGSGIFEILNDGVPAGNIVIITGTGTRFGADSDGNIGTSTERVWAHGANLKLTITNAVTAAGVDYAAQFPLGQNTIGVLGSGHNRTTGAQRVVNLNLAVNGAANDNAAINAVEAFLNGPHSYKAGSLKLFVVKRLNLAIRAIAMATVTSANALATAAALLNDVRQGNF